VLIFPTYGQPLKTPAIERTETCQSNPKHTYQIFVPEVDTSFRQIPLLISIDPHGDGKLAVNGFKEAAQKYQVIIVGSNLIKNNDLNYISEIDELVADVKKRYPVGKILFVGGFSGGARMAIGYAVDHAISGVIAYGALAPAKQLAGLKCRVFAVTGTDDFNFVEAAQFVIDPQQMPSNLLIETTNATHEWPSKSIMQQSLGYMLLSTMPPGTPAEKKKMVQEYTTQQKNRIDNLMKTSNYIQAALITRNLFQFSYFEREGAFFSLFDQISNDTNYQQQVDRLSRSVQFEEKVRNGFYSDILEKDSVWWRQDVDFLNSKIETEKDEFMMMAYKRIKGFLGIFCYSMCDRFANEKDTAKLEKVLIVYRITEPKNPDMLQFTKKLEQLKKSQ
jgi:predicted esterase